MYFRVTESSRRTIWGERKRERESERESEGEEKERGKTRARIEMVGNWRVEGGCREDIKRSPSPRISQRHA
jgi:hypothetical protein